MIGDSDHTGHDLAKVIVENEGDLLALLDTEKIRDARIADMHKIEAERLDCLAEEIGALRDDLEKRSATIADLGRRLGEALTVLADAREELRLIRMKDHGTIYNPALSTRIALVLDATPPPPVAEAGGERYLTGAEQKVMKRALRASSRLVANGEAVPQPTADHTERARELVYRLLHNTAGSAHMVALVAEALAVAERAGAEKMREQCAKHLDERAIDIRDNGPKGTEGLLTALAGAHMGALFDAAAELRGGAWRRFDITPAFGRRWDQVTLADCQI